ncbi:MAG TPA: hypothetical protein VK827_03330 [Lysobacter sp.]|nr:hypothetical protein [Lysobacter sp.]
MSVESLLRDLRHASLRRAVARAALQVLPWLLVAAALAWRLRETPWWPAVLVLPAAMGAWHLSRAARGFDTRWLAQALDARRPDMEDSAALLFASELNELQLLQRARLKQRLVNAPMPDLRARWNARVLVGNALLAAAFMVVLLAWPATQHTATASRVPAVPATAAQPARLVAQAIDIRAPAYTGLPKRSVDTLTAKVPEGATLHWRLRFAPEPASVELRFHDGSTLALKRDGDQWQASMRIDRPMLYRIVLQHPLPAAQAGPHRLEVVRDRAPELRALRPARSLSLVTPGQRYWDLAFDASDDYALASAAQLRITRTEGSGENITATQRTIALRGRGSAKQRRYSHRIDLATLGMVEGDDVIVQLTVSDRRTPKAQVTRGPSFILRWPPPKAMESTGLDGLAKKTLPAYFRSQRQIIIDAEALLQDKRKLAPDTYLERSDAIGVDQRLLRLRYGQFLGEESEGAPLLPTNDAQDEQAHADEDLAAEPDAAVPNDAAVADAGHDHAPEVQREARFGEEAAVLEQYGHTHDIPEAATLLDPATRKLLRAALDEMWQSELQLRQGEPGRALPYANRALRLIKQVQQAERIYLPRLGMQLPPIDLGRRLGGDRAGLADRADPIRPATGADPVLADAWRALAPRPAGSSPDLDALSAWLASNAKQVTDPLALAEAMDAVRRDGDCADCRRRLRAALWPLLQRPPAATGERMAPDRAGEAYLDALGGEGAR